jgi:hypothetical protein
MSHVVRAALLRGVIAVSAMTTPWAAGSDFAAAACEVPAAAIHPLVDRDGGLSHYVQLTDDCLKTMYLYCSAASKKAVLGQGPMMACSLGHEALLKRVFDGDFDALLAWWQSHRDLAPRN